MSFLNPVNEPVLRFKSTDADAPQINYNARTAGDVKAVLKACLVTGYGAKASAGWSIANEVDHVCEFVSPSAAMSDYRLGIDDTSTSSTTWYYQHQDTKETLRNPSASKSLSYIKKTSANNGWQLLVTNRGIIFIEILHSTVLDKVVTRMTCFSQVKSALLATGGANMAFFSIGFAGAIGTPSNFYGTGNLDVRLEGYDSFTNIGIQLSDAVNFTSSSYVYGLSSLDLVSRMYLKNLSAILGQMPAIWTRATNNVSDLGGVTDVNLDGKNVLDITLGYSNPNLSSLEAYARRIYIDLDYWEY